ncbi:AMP-binding protein [Methylobrevis pamukkalensis]|uniref:Phenyloxazoline synthase MbtB n=1 Tax=Methylobrevis pamukkalensis TaxID=1439726 RepID=A0A1E3H755_9HYPH|nr:AMP-binding protein [Methylobrevis pamukkalensis]ODN72167.1 Phenyloxazoline synthase MbtB [Methylobrevis pamukkalensis]
MSQTPQVTLDHQASEIDGALVCNWDAVEDLFPAGLLDDMFAAYADLLTRLARKTSAWDMRVDLVGDGPCAAMNRDAVLALDGADGRLHDGIFHVADAAPDRPAVFGGGLELTFGDLAGRARALAARLQALGARPNDLVAISLEKGPAQVVAALGVMASGAAYVPIDPDLPRARRDELMADTGARLLVCADEGDNENWPADVIRVAVPACAGELPAPVATRATDLAT